MLYDEYHESIAGLDGRKSINVAQEITFDDFRKIIKGIGFEIIPIKIKGYEDIYWCLDNNGVLQCQVLHAKLGEEFVVLVHFLDGTIFVKARGSVAYIAVAIKEGCHAFIEKKQKAMRL